MTSHVPSTSHDRCLAIYYEHPEWFTPLFAELDRREIASIVYWLRRVTSTQLIVTRGMPSSSTA